MSTAKPLLKPLTALRFFAALHVLLFHAYDQFSGALIFQWPKPALNVLNSGFVGVSIFFILSGFILTYNYADQDVRKPQSVKIFWLARFARIYPVYLLGLLLAAPKFFSALPLSDQGPATTGLIAVSALSLTQAWVPDFALAWNAPGWSLSAEAVFYLLFPTAALLINRLHTKRAMILGMITCWLALLVPPTLFYLLQPSAPAWSGFIKFNPLIRLPEFLMGIFLGKLFLVQWRQSDGRPARSGLWLAVASSAICAALCCRPLWPKLLLHNGFFAPLFALLILCLAWIGTQPNLLNRILSSPSLILLGEASYAMYILHVPVKGLWFGTLKALSPIAVTDPIISSFAFLAYLACTLLLAIATFKYVEVPARRLIKGWFGRPAAGSRSKTFKPVCGAPEEKVLHSVLPIIGPNRSS